MLNLMFLCCFILGGVDAFLSLKSNHPFRNVMANVEITKGVEFDTVAREWRMKWSEEKEKESLAQVQEIVDATLGEIKAIDGVKSVQRVVCGGCLDYKIITSVDAAKFGDWEAAGFAPEEKFLAEVSKLEGITTVETQTFTIMPM
mmetsp:Transcript_65740/g.132320  ORF Transcript_65740/g.132320 Transcript_65740/m.132320 type:complete len:145 (-) Transcript_65740:399-833(-)